MLAPGVVWKPGRHPGRNFTPGSVQWLTSPRWPPEPGIALVSEGIWRGSQFQVQEGVTPSAQHGRGTGTLTSPWQGLPQPLGVRRLPRSANVPGGLDGHAEDGSPSTQSNRTTHPGPRGEEAGD